MVQLRAARRVHYTARVKLEDRLVRLNRNRDRLLRNCRHERRLGIDRYIRVARESRRDRLALRYARIRSRRRVRICRLRGDALVLDDILERVIHETTVAALITLRNRAIYKLLLREADERAILQKPRALGRSRRREGPARAALLLVLYSRDGTLRGPIDTHRESRLVQVIPNLETAADISLHRLERAEVAGAELIRREICELIHTHCPAVTSVIMGADLLEILVIDSLAEVALRRRVDLAILSRPLGEGRKES